MKICLQWSDLIFIELEGALGRAQPLPRRKYCFIRKRETKKNNAKKKKKSKQARRGKAKGTEKEKSEHAIQAFEEPNLTVYIYIYDPGTFWDYFVGSLYKHVAARNKSTKDQSHVHSSDISSFGLEHYSKLSFLFLVSSLFGIYHLIWYPKGVSKLLLSTLVLSIHRPGLASGI